jgi:hypothetical protein
MTFSAGMSTTQRASALAESADGLPDAQVGQVADAHAAAQQELHGDRVARRSAAVSCCAARSGCGVRSTCCTTSATPDVPLPIALRLAECLQSDDVLLDQICEIQGCELPLAQQLGLDIGPDLQVLLVQVLGLGLDPRGHRGLPGLRSAP